MMDLELRSIEFGGPSGPGAPLAARRNSRAAATTTWMRGDSRNQLVYAFMPWLRAGRPSMRIGVTLKTRAPQRQAVWVSTRMQTGSYPVALGGVEPTRVVIEAGEHTRTYPFEATDVALDVAGVGRHVVSWEWEVATARDGKPVGLGASEHEVFAILEAPAAPWSGDVSTPGELVWTDVLEWSCRWAAGARGTPEAALRVAQRLNAIGGLGVATFGFADRFRWRDQSEYLNSEAFQCEYFLSLLRGETNRGPAWGNCRDVAAALVVFTNALGCALRRGYIGVGGGANWPLNEVRAIGLTRQETIHATPHGFVFHELAADVSAGTPTVAYDALLEITENVASHPTPSSFEVAAGLPFSGLPNAYLERVVHADAIDRVFWTTRDDDLTIERPVRRPPPPDVAYRYQEFLRILERPPDGGAAGSVPGVPGYTPARSLYTRPVHSWYVPDDGLTRQVFVIRPEDRPDVTILIALVVCSGTDAARRLTAERLAWSSLPLSSPPGTIRYLADAVGQLGGYAVNGQSVIVSVGPETRFDVRPLVAALALAMA